MPCDKEKKRGKLLIEKELMEYDLIPPNPGEKCCVVGCRNPVSMICFPYCSHHGEEGRGKVFQDPWGGLMP